MQETSLDAYRKLEPKLQQKEQPVYNFIWAATQCGMDVTDTEIANALRWKINCVTGRRNSLVKKGLVVQSRKRFNPETKCINIAWRATK